MTGLHVDSVRKEFDSRQILTDIFVSCKKGEIVGLLGLNGTGKSTLMKIIFGSLKADRKFVKVEGNVIDGLFDNRKLINYLPQDSFLPNHVFIKNIISLFCNKENAQVLLNHKLIQPLVTKKSRQLSGGEKRLIEIFLIIYSDAKFILIDEPFNGVAPVYKEEIKSLIREQSKFKGFIISDHDYMNILDIATRVILMHDGGTKEIKGKAELNYWGYIP
ncbi:MAG: ATP-binding cassette domain-containing protein [Bacteroidales bacterium]|nr:ATP-binding cassette domain-containing protein [Bacteroidales bacterium]